MSSSLNLSEMMEEYKSGVVLITEHKLFCNPYMVHMVVDKSIDSYR